MAFEAIGRPGVRTECPVSCLDHILLYVNDMTPDDYSCVQSAAMRYAVPQPMR